MLLAGLLVLGREAEVNDFDHAVLHQEILELDVSVHVLNLVHLSECAEHLETHLH